MLNGGNGIDTMDGGLGNDQLLYTAAGREILDGGAGTDTVRQSPSYTTVVGPFGVAGRKPLTASLSHSGS